MRASNDCCQYLCKRLNIRKNMFILFSFLAACGGGEGAFLSGNACLFKRLCN